MDAEKDIVALLLDYAGLTKESIAGALDRPDLSEVLDALVERRILSCHDGLFFVIPIPVD